MEGTYAITEKGVEDLWGDGGGGEENEEEREWVEADGGGGEVEEPAITERNQAF